MYNIHRSNTAGEDLYKKDVFDKKKALDSKENGFKTEV